MPIRQFANTLDMRGRNGLSLATKQLIFTIWNNYSIITVDRRNGRDQVLIQKNQYDFKYSSLRVPSDVKIELVQNLQNREMARKTRRIAIKAVQYVR